MGTIKLEKLLDTNTGVYFYPTPKDAAESRASQFKKEDETLETGLDRRMFQVQGTGHAKLDPTAIFKSFNETSSSKLAPEQTITLFALRLAIIEKLASGIGTLAFIWASTIILGGFASNINSVDFVVVAIILTTEGTRIFSRGRELEWQHMASKRARSDSRFQILQEASPEFATTSLNKASSKTSSKRSVDENDTSLSREKSSWTENKRDLRMRPSVSFARSTRFSGKSSNSDWESCGIQCRQEKVESFPGIDENILNEIITRTSSWQTESIAVTRNAISSFGNRGENSLGSEGSQMRLSLRRYASEPEKVLLQSPGSINIKDVHLKSMERSNTRGLERTQSCMPERAKSFKEEPVCLGISSPQPERINPYRPIVITNTSRTWSSEVVPVLPAGMSKFVSNRGISAVLSWVQVISAVICLVLSGWRISQQDFDPPGLKDDRPVNMYMCINLFYILALLEAFMFLLERGYWEYKMNYQQLILQVNNKAGLGLMGHEIMLQFFYEVYKKCVEGSVFDGLEMDLVEFSLTLVQSDNTFEQLGALRVLRSVVERYDGFSSDALRRIGTTPGVIERLVEMLSWRSPHHGDILQEVAALVCRAVRYSKNCVRIASVPGSMEMIVSLVRSSDRDRVATSTVDRSMMDTLPSTIHNVIALRLDGMRILVAQAREPSNLLKIGQSRGLVPALVSYIAIKNVEQFKKLGGPEMKMFKKVLRLLALLVGARNVSGTILRPIIARVVSCIASMRDILQFGDCHPQLQWMAIEILTNMALDNDVRVSIGGTGGIIRNLLTLYIRGSGGSGTFLDTDIIGKLRQAVSKRAGEALSFLAIENQKNCLRMMELEQNGKKAFIPALIGLLSDQKEQTILAAKILRSLMEYADDGQQREIAACAPRLMRLLMCTSNMKLLEAVTGLAPRVVGFLKDADYNHVVETVDRDPLIQKLLMNLDHDPQMFTAFPRTRRYTIECILALIKRDPIFLDKFTRQGELQRKLVKTLDSVCEVENFLTFSGTEGLTRYSMSVEDLVHQTLLETRLLVSRQKEDAYGDLQFIIVHD